MSADKQSLERQQLSYIIRQWNDNRLDLFALSEPNDDLEFHGVMRFYFQDAGQKVATKCIRVSSTASSQDVIQTLIEKFHPDFRMLSVPEYGLYEIHESGEERKLSEEEKPLLVQLNWHKDDREGRFLLRRMDEKTYFPGLEGNNPEGNHFNRRLSKKKKKEKKKRERKDSKEINDKDKDGIASRLYNEIPETSFTRSISNPEAVMRRRRQQKLEKKLQQLCQEGGPDAGGTLRIFGESLNKDVPYKTLLLSTKDTAGVIVKEILNKYGKDREDSNQFCLVQLIVPHEIGDNSMNDTHIATAGIRQYILDDDDCPLFIEKQHNKARGTLTFHIKRRPADYQPRKRKKKPEMIKGELDAGYNTKYDEVMEKLSYLDVNSKIDGETQSSIAESVSGDNHVPSVEPLTIPEMHKFYEALQGVEITVIKLPKSNNCMGLSIVAAKGPNQDKMGIYIKSVVQGGAADLDGRLQAGDLLLKVDGHSLLGISQERAAELITQTGSVVTLEVAKQAAIHFGLGVLIHQQSPSVHRGYSSPRRLSETMPHLRYKSEIEPPKTNPLVANGYNGLPPHMQPHLRHPSKSVPTLNSDGNDSHVPADKPYPQPVTQLPHSRTSSTTSIPRSVAESVKQMYPNHKGPEGLPPNGHYYSGFQPPPGSPSIPMTPPMYVQHQNATRPEIGYGNASMTLPTYPHSAARMSDKDKLKMQVNGIQPHLQSATSRIQPSKSVPTLNSDQEIPRPIGQPYAITTSTNVIPRYIAQQQHQQQLLKMNRPPESDQWPGRYPNTQIMQQLQQQQQPPSSPTAQMSPMYNSNHSRPNSQLSMQSQPHHRNSYQSSYPEERHYQNVQNLNMHHLHANNTYQNAENTMNVSQPPMNVHPQHLPPPVPPQHQPQRLQQQPQVHPHYQQHLQQIPPPLPPHQQPQYNHSVPNHHMQSQLQPHQMQQIQQQKLYQQQLLQHQRLQRLKLEELRRQQELQLAHQAEERLLRDAKRRQEEEPRLQRPQQLRFELPNSEHNEDIPPPLPKSPPPVENNPQQRLERLLLSSASASNESLPVRSANKSKEPLNQNSKPKVSWTDSTPTVLNLETNATNNGPVNNVHSFTLQDIDEVLDIEDDPEFNDRFTAGNTPNVIGAQEVYRDPRDRIKAEKMRHEAQKTELKVPEKLSFKEKMKMFAMEDNTPKDKLKISKAQREIETGPSPAKDETCDDSSQEVNS